MTTTEMLDWFNILQDKYASPYFTQGEQLTFLNRATWSLVYSYFPSGTNNSSEINIDLNSNTLKDLAPLIYEIDTLSMSSTGVISDSSINSQLISDSGDSTAEYIRILSIGIKRGNKRYPCSLLRQNDKEAHQASYNFFKNPTYYRPKYTHQNNGLKFYPIDTNATIYLTVVKSPVSLSLSPNVDSDLPETLHNLIVAIGLEFAGIASRDEVLATMANVQK